MAYNKVNEGSFELVKKLLDAGLSKSQIMKIVDMSACTIQNIEQSVDLEDYREIVRRQFERKAQYDTAKQGPKPLNSGKNSYTVTMVINVDAERENLVAPLTALVNNMFNPNNVAVEARRSDN